MTRYFAFGCSYCNYDWIMVPDLIGVNFDEYYNFGKSGACHTFILAMLIQANELYKFNPETDYVTIGVTGLGRFSIVSNEEWATHGDIFPYENIDHPEKAVFWAKNLDNHTWAIYRSLMSLKTIKLILTSLNIKHTIYLSIFNKYRDIEFLERTPLTAPALSMIEEITNILDIKESIDEIILDRRSQKLITKFDWMDDHPDLYTSFEYVKKHVPEYATTKSISIIEDEMKKMSNCSTRQDQFIRFNNDFCINYRTDYHRVEHLLTFAHYNGKA